MYPKRTEIHHKCPLWSWRHLDLQPKHKKAYRNLTSLHLKPKACILDYFKKLQSFSVHCWRHPKNSVFYHHQRGASFLLAGNVERTTLPNDVNPHTYRWASISLSEEMLNYERYHRHTDDNIILVDITAVENIRNTSKCVIVFFLAIPRVCWRLYSRWQWRWETERAMDRFWGLLYTIHLRVFSSSSCGDKRRTPEEMGGIFILFYQPTLTSTSTEDKPEAADKRENLWRGLR